MAERRMLTKKVTDNDNFLLLSSSAQALYLHLTMAADDEGFCNQVSLSMFKAHASVQDLEALIDKKYIIQFESGVIVLKHWRMANTYRKDRCKPTVYRDELSKLYIKENGAYTLAPDGCQMVAKMAPDGCQDGTEMAPQNRIEENRLEEKRIEDKGVHSRPSFEVNYQPVADMYNETCVSFPRLTTLSDARKKAIKARLKTYTMDDFKRLFEKAEASSFLKGANNRNWSANFDWLIKDCNMAKVLDGNYDDRGSQNPAAGHMSQAARELDDFYGMVADWVESKEGQG